MTDPREREIGTEFEESVRRHNPKPLSAEELEIEGIVAGHLPGRFTRCDCDFRPELLREHLLAITIDAQAETIRELRAALDDWEEREAAICPEDVGFEEMITVLSRQLAEARAALAAADGGPDA